MLSKIQEIADATGNEKLEVLSKYPELKWILKATYDPHIKYYITVDLDVMERDPDGRFKCYFENNCIDSKLEFLLKHLTARTLSGNDAKEAVADYVYLLSEDQAKLFQGIINKDLRLDIGVKSINKVWPGLIPAIKGGGLEKPIIPLCNNLKFEKIEYPVLASIKHDGVRGRESGGKILSRSYKAINGMNHIEEELKKYPFDLDGELIVPGNQFDSASGLIRNLEPVPQAVFMIFDADLPGGKYERYLSLLSHLESSRATSPVKLIHQRIINNYEELMEYYLNTVKSGHEGIVICPRDGLYEDRRCWWRLVPLKTADCKVIGFYEGKGKLVGSLGGIIVDYKGHKVRVGSGFAIKYWFDLSKADKEKNPNQELYDDKVRHNIFCNQDLFIGKIAECQFKEETKAGSMRQPTFKCWRYDKSTPNVD